jgi:hypothetical protein
MKKTTILRNVRHADGTSTRLHVAIVRRGTPTRARKTWILGYRVAVDGCAYGGADCIATKEEAYARFDRVIAECSCTYHKRKGDQLVLGERAFMNEVDYQRMLWEDSDHG